MALALGLALGFSALVLGLRGLRPPQGDLARLAGDREALFALFAERARRRAPSASPSLADLEPLREEEARALFPQLVGRSGDFHTFDPFVGYRLRPLLDRRVPFAEHPHGAIRVRTNSLGLRMDREPLEPRPDLRLLVLGDSHTEGACENDETFCARLEAELAARVPARTVEVLAAGRAGWSFYQYLGALESFRALEPHAVVVVVYTGNDFFESLLLHHWFWRSVPAKPPEDPGPQVPSGAWTQWFRQLAHFAAHPRERELALEAALAVTREIARRCAERGQRLELVALPAMGEVRPQDSGRDLARAALHLGLDEEALGVTARLTDEWIAQLAREGLSVLDLRGPFRGAHERLYWPLDQHIDLAGHVLVAARLAERLGS